MSVKQDCCAIIAQTRSRSHLYYAKDSALLHLTASAVGKTGAAATTGRSSAPAQRRKEIARGDTRAARHRARGYAQACRGTPQGGQDDQGIGRRFSGQPL